MLPIKVFDNKQMLSSVYEDKNATIGHSTTSIENYTILLMLKFTICYKRTYIKETQPSIRNRFPFFTWRNAVRPANGYNVPTKDM